MHCGRSFFEFADAFVSHSSYRAFFNSLKKQSAALEKMWQRFHMIDASASIVGDSGMKHRLLFSLTLISLSKQVGAAFLLQGKRRLLRVQTVFKAA